jgi:hypothetical protein
MAYDEVILRNTGLICTAGILVRYLMIASRLSAARKDTLRAHCTAMEISREQGKKTVFSLFNPRMTKST